MTQAAIIADIRARRAVMTLVGRRHRRRGPLPRQLQPDAIRLSYFGSLLRMLEQAKTGVQRVVPRLQEVVRRQQVERGDARLDMSDEELNDLMDKTAKEFFAEFTNSKLAELAQQAARRTSGFQRQELAKQFKNALGIDIVKAEPWLEPRIKAFTTENVALIKSIPQRYFEQVEQRVIRGMREGLRWEEIAKQLDKRFEVAEGHAKLVARDQVGKWMGELNRERQKDLGVTHYIWRTSRDNRVREEHEALEGEKIAWDDPPDEGHPGHAINCIPCDAFLSSYSRVLKAYRRWYSGELTTLVTDAGETASATPNHPVLTRRGWIPIQDVDVGEDVFQAPFEGVERLIANPKHVISTAEEFFRALAPLGVLHRVPGRAARFHGDGIHEEVDVVTIDWSLGDKLEPALSQSFCQQFLTRADQPALSLGPLAHLFGRAALAAHGIVRGGCKALAFACGSLPHPESHGGAAISWFEALANEVGTNGFSTDAEAFRQLLHTPAATEEPGRFLARILLGVVCRAIDSAYLDATIAELSAEIVGIDAQRGGGFGEAHPLLQHPLRVIEKRVGEYTGHVFNLQTSAGWYASQSLIVHNCRCQAEPVLEPIIEAIEGTSGTAPPEPQPAEPVETPPEPPRTLEELHEQQLPKVMEELFGEQSHSTEVVWNDSYCDANWANGAREIMTGRILMSSERSRAIAGAINAAASGMTELGSPALTAFKTYVHEHIHGLGHFRQIIPKGAQLTPATIARYPGVQTALVASTRWGMVLEEGSTELLALRNYRVVLERLGFKAIDSTAGPLRTTTRQEHSYLPFVRAMEILVQRATGQAVTLGADVGEVGEKILRDLNMRWSPMERPAKLAKVLAKGGSPAASRDALDERTRLLESYIKEIVPARARADQFEKGFQFSASMDEELKLLQEAKTIEELSDLKKKMRLP